MLYTTLKVSDRAEHHSSKGMTVTNALGSLMLFLSITVLARLDSLRLCNRPMHLAIGRHVGPGDSYQGREPSTA